MNYHKALNRHTVHTNSILLLWLFIFSGKNQKTEGPGADPTAVGEDGEIEAPGVLADEEEVARVQIVEVSQYLYFNLPQHIINSNKTFVLCLL